MSRIHQSHPGFDIEAEIIKAGNVPSPVDLRPWQDRIDKIVGKTVEGRSMLRVVWGQSFDATMWCLSRRRHKYPFWRYEEDGEIRDIGTPRFYVEELHGLAELKANDGWERSRYQWEEGVRYDVLGPIPEEGFYSSVFLIAHHDEWCCRGNGYMKGEICIGAYRPPTDADLTRIRRMKQRRDSASNTENAPTPDLVTKWAYEARQKRDEKFRNDIHERMMDWFAAHGHRITDSTNPKIVKHGKYGHFIADNPLAKDTTNADSNSASAA